MHHSLQEQGYTEVFDRDISALLNPRPVLLVGSFREKANFATIIWATPISHDPAMLAVALRNTSKTFQDLQATECFSINILDASLANLPTLCGTQSGHDTDKSKLVPHYLAKHIGREPSSSAEKQIPFVKEALSIIDCQVESIIETGDHNLILAYVCGGWTRKKDFEEGAIPVEESLLCVKRQQFTTL